MNVRETAANSIVGNASIAVTPDGILQLGMSFWGSKALLSAIELGVFSALASGPADLEALRKRIGLHPRAARDFLDALVALKMLEREDGVYRNSAETDTFLDKAKQSYIGGLLEMANTRLYGFWGSLTEALRTGEHQNEGKYGEDFFAAMYAKPQILHGFLTAMSGVSAGAAHAIAAKFRWDDHASFVDIGAAQGMVPVTLARAYPHLRGIGFDLPQVQPVFEGFVAEQGLSDRTRFQAGNFFEDELPRADVIVMGHILHDWDLARKKLLLVKSFAALPKGGAFIVYDAIIDDDRRKNAFGLLMSLNMLTRRPEDLTIPALIAVPGCAKRVSPRLASSISLARIAWLSVSSRKACHLQADSSPIAGAISRPASGVIRALTEALSGSTSVKLFPNAEAAAQRGVCASARAQGAVLDRRGDPRRPFTIVTLM